MSINPIVSLLDQLSYRPYIFTEKSDRLKSTISALLGLIVFIIVFSLTVFFLQNTLKRDKPVVVFNEREDFIPNINVSSYPFSFVLNDGDKGLEDPTIFEIKVYYMVYDFKTLENNTVIRDNKFVELPSERCDKNVFEAMNLSLLNYTLCLNPNKNNISISGIYGDFTKGFSYLNFYLNRCANITTTELIDGVNKNVVKNSNNATDRVCQSPEKIERYLKNVFFAFGTPMHYLNHNNFHNPFIFKYRSFSLPMGSTMFKRYFISLKNVIYETDVGLLFEEKKFKTSFVFASQEVSVDLRVGAFIFPTAFGQLTFNISSVSSYYNRSYPKLQTVAANVGGVLNMFYTLGMIIMYSFTKYNFFFYLINECYSVNSADHLNNSNQDIKNIKEINFIHLNSISQSVQQNNSTVYSCKNYKYELNLMERIFPSLLCSCRKNVKRYLASEDILSDKLSYLNILNNMIKFENLLEILLTEEQQELFKRIPKRKLEDSKSAVNKEKFLSESNYPNLQSEADNFPNNNVLSLNLQKLGK